MEKENQRLREQIANLEREKRDLQSQLWVTTQTATDFESKYTKLEEKYNKKKLKFKKRKKNLKSVKNI